MAGYIGSSTPVVSSGSERKYQFITTAGQTEINVEFTPGFTHVFQNGVRLRENVDYTGSGGNLITLTNSAEENDEIVVIVYSTFQVSDAYTKSEADTKFVDILSEQTVEGNKNFTGSLQKDSDDVVTEAATQTLTNKTLTNPIISGGAYFGGTSSASLLDDYEEGTWTPTIAPSTGSSTVEYGAIDAWYRKIGDVYIVSCSIHLTSVGTGGSGRIRVLGIPAVTTNASAGSGYINNVASGTTGDFLFVGIDGTPDEVGIYLNTETSVSSSFDAWGRLSNTSRIEFTAVYK